MTLARLAALAAAVLLAGCATAVHHIPNPERDQPRKLVVFLDGTANDEGSYTNVARLRNLVTLQANPDINTTYIRGVGTDGKPLGMAMGWGIGYDVREAYRFLGEHYDARRGDEIYIFGFSRGAYAARILAAMLHVAGVEDLRAVPEKKRARHVRRIYRAYKSKKNVAGRRADVAEVLGYQPESVPVRFMGLWDTVEALGVPDYEEDWKNPNGRYADQLCNVERAAHAVALDDDRARVFTPILLTSKHLVRDCPQVSLDEVVEEVWFAGAHADVGGGYDDTHIGGVSLNWMLGQIGQYGLVPEGARVYADWRGRTHDPEAGMWGLIYRKRNRSLDAYAEFTTYNGGKLKLHRSALERLAWRKPEIFEFQWLKSERFGRCFEAEGRGLRYRAGSECFSIVEED